MKYFLDNASTTRPYKEVVDTVAGVMYNYYGNPSSTHKLGQEAKVLIENVRDQIAADINCDPEEIIFTSGACEANSLAYSVKNLGYYYSLSDKLEHKSLELINKHYADFVPNDKYGNIDIEELERLLTQNYGFLSIQSANSEIGTIQNISKISELTKPYCTVFHTDATQLYPERKINVRELGIDLMSVSAQKFHGPKGVGFLYCRNGLELHRLISGSQERGLRGGTYNTPGIAGMGKALEMTRANQEKRNAQIKSVRDKLAAELLQIDSVYLNGPSLNANRLCSNISLQIDGVKAADLVTTASMYGIYISAGSACSSGEAVPSSTLKAIGLTDEQALSTIRITVDESLTDNDIWNIVTIMHGLINQLRS